jgi:hypothetical protein
VRPIGLEKASLFPHDCTSQIHTERREKGFEYTPERETKERFIIAALLSHRLYHVFVFIALKTNAQRKQQH